MSRDRKLNRLKKKIAAAAETALAMRDRGEYPFSSSYIRLSAACPLTVTDYDYMIDKLSPNSNSNSFIPLIMHEDLQVNKLQITIRVSHGHT